MCPENMTTKMTIICVWTAQAWTDCMCTFPRKGSKSDLKKVIFLIFSIPWGPRASLGVQRWAQGCLWAALGVLFGAFGDPLGDPWPSLGALRFPLGTHWAPFGAPWGFLGCLWVPFGPFGPFWASPFGFWGSSTQRSCHCFVCLEYMCV